MLTMHDPVMRDLNRMLRQREIEDAEHDAWLEFRQEHDITDSMDRKYAQNFVADVAELVDTYERDDAELGRHVRQLIEQEYRKQWEASHD